MLGYWPYATYKKTFLYLIKTQAPQKENKPYTSISKFLEKTLIKKKNFPKPNFTHTRLTLSTQTPNPITEK